MRKLSIYYVERPNPADPDGSAHSYLALIDECEDDPNALNCRALAMAVVKRVMYVLNNRDYEIPDDETKRYSRKGRAASDSWILYRGLD